MDDETIFHCVIFFKTVFYELVEDFKVNDFCKIKGEVIKTNKEHSLINLFHIERLE